MIALLFLFVSPRIPWHLYFKAEQKKIQAVLPFLEDIFKKSMRRDSVSHFVLRIDNNIFSL
jgi:hypothetical protein